MLKSRHAQLNKQTKSPIDLPKISAYQLSRSSQNFPPWLRDNSCVKSLPAIYHGVLGQVQIPGQQNVDYHNRLTDTQRVYRLLATSRLSKQTLATIWAHVNKTYPGQLTNKELCLALSLIALFQKPNIKDPFTAIKTEKSPPTPTLHPQSPPVIHPKPAVQQLISLIDDDSVVEISQNNFKNNNSPLCSDYTVYDNIQSPARKSHHREISLNTTNPYVGDYEDQDSGNDKSRVDVSNILDNDDFITSLVAGGSSEKIHSVWIRQMTACKTLFKRVFDILNVEHGRSAALESLKTAQGSMFIDNFCRCYPIAYRIWSKAMDVNKTNKKNKFMGKVNEIMTSINESWAVLVNLFNEVGHGSSIDSLMDRLMLTYDYTNSDNATLAGQSNSVQPSCFNFTSLHKQPCAICQTIVPDESVIKSQCGNYQYHSTCANFWINQVESVLPFNDQILTAKVLTPVKQHLIATIKEFDDDNSSIINTTP